MDQRLETVKECNVCGAIDFVDELIAGAWTLRRCVTCQYVFTSPRYCEEELSRIYRESYYENSEQYFQTQIQPPSTDDVALGRSIRKLCTGDHPRSLDVGTGVGKMVTAFSKAGFQAQGTELSDLACKVAQAHGRDVINARLETFQAASYQCVSAFHVLEHVPSPTEFLKEMTRIASPGGIVLVEVPNFGCKASRKLRENWFALFPDTHLSHFTPQTLSNLCGRCGLEVIRAKRLGGAGLFANTSGRCCSPPKPTSDGQVDPATKNTERSLRSIVWSIRKPLLKSATIRRLARWINWELLGHGEFIQLICRKPA